MATTGGGKPAPLRAPEKTPAPPPRPAPGGGGNAESRFADPFGRPYATVVQRLFTEGFAFDFFQAVRLLELLDPAKKPVGRIAPPRAEVVRFRAHLALSFPASAVHEIVPPSERLPMPAMTVTFMGLTGPSGVLPRHYTELLLHLERYVKGPERTALRAWLDLFNHRLISLFFRAWEKYRFFIPYERREYALDEPDAFTRCLFSLVGLGMKPLRRRLCVSVREEADGLRRERFLAGVDDLGLLYYAGFLSHRPRCAVALEAFLNDFFQLPIKVRQFQGQWLKLDAANQSRLGGEDGNNEVGVNLVAGDRVWDVQNKIRVRIGPLSYRQFNDWLPDRSAVSQRKAFFLLAHLVRLYVGPELDFDVQLILRAREIPPCRMASGPGGPQLGWNTWICSQRMRRDAEDAVFEGEAIRWVNSLD
jgi:type VI secretion system protein ImpH